MNRKNRAISLALALALLLCCAAGCAGGGEDNTLAQTDETEGSTVQAKIEGSSLYVTKVENMPEDFILGMDASCVPALERAGVTYYDFDGNEVEDVYQLLADCGVNYIRVRVWNNPYDEDGNGYGGGNCDIENCIEIGKRATACGMKLLVDFHYSDFWADPSKQMVPLAWEDMTFEEKEQALYEFTVDCLQQLVDAGVDVGMVQIGNETNGAFCGETKWAQICPLFSAGAKAVREVCPDALVALHFTNPESVDRYSDYAFRLDYYSVDYDVFASSYYPNWHGTLENLATELNKVTETYGKAVMVAETNYAYTSEDTDYSGGGPSGTQTYPYSVQGQANSVRDVIDTVVNSCVNGIGVFYWEGTWIATGGSSWEENSVLWETYGTGWASSYAAAYDPDDAGKYYGGCATDYNAMFDATGHPLESLRVFNLVRYGNEVENVPDAILSQTVQIDLNGTIALPETVTAVMLDGSQQEVAVTWDVTDADYEAMRTGGVAEYTYTGTANGMEATITVQMIEFNFLDDYSFEDSENKEQSAAWTVINYGAEDTEIYVEAKASDSKTGTNHYHFWNESADAINFDLQQEVTLEAGSYKFSICTMGGDCGESYTAYIYVIINGETVCTEECLFTAYDEWHTAEIPSFTVADGDSVTVGIHVEISAAGAWGKIDDALLNSLS